MLNIIRPGAVMLGLTLAVASGASAQVASLPLAPSVWVATMEPVLPPSEETEDAVVPPPRSGTCTLFVTRSGHRAAVQCAVEGVTPTTVSFFAARFGLSSQPLVSAAVPRGSAPAVTVDMPPASIIDALPANEARIELHDDSGLLARGIFSTGNATWTRITLDGTQVVPPSRSDITGDCDVVVTESTAGTFTVVETPARVGVDCALTAETADSTSQSDNTPDSPFALPVDDSRPPVAITVNAGAAGQTGSTLGAFTAPAGDSRPTVWTTATSDLVQAARTGAPYYVQVGTGIDAIRGQADGCRRDNYTLCLLDRFEVTAEGELGTDETRGNGEAEQISTRLGLLRMRGTDMSGVQINTLSGITVYIKNSCKTLPAFTLQLALNGGTTSVYVRDTETAIGRTFLLDSVTGTVIDQTTFPCS